MKKTTKKRLFTLIVVIISASLITTSQAATISSLNIGDIDYSYEGEISAGKAEQIVKSLFALPDETAIRSFSIFCIFGHSIQTALIITTEHNFYTTVPRCKQTHSSVEYCTRDSCSYYRVTDERVIRVGCH